MIRKSSECVCVRGLLDAFADDELTKRERIKVVLHLTRCEICVEELLNIRAVTCMLKAMPAVIPVCDLAFKVTFAATSVIQPETYKAQPLSIERNRFGVANIWGQRTWKYATCVSISAVFVLGFWMSWKTPDELMPLFKTVRAKNVLVPTDCYIAHPLDSLDSQIHETSLVDQTDNSDRASDSDEPSSLTEAMGLKTDEDGLYAIEI